MDKYVKKKVLHAGRSCENQPEYAKDWQLTVHFRAETLGSDVDSDDDNGSPHVLDDTRKQQPLQLLLGKEFKLEVLEACIKTMAVGEVAEFVIDKRLLHTYPFVMKTLRDSWLPAGSKKAAERRAGGHCCGMLLAQPGSSTASPTAQLGYEDLEELMRKPRALRFTVELVAADGPGSYSKDSWAMNDQEKLASIEQLRLAGNSSYSQSKYQAAGDSYRQALGHLESLMLREKPGSDEWLQLQRRQLPLLLNLAQCQLLLGDNYGAIEQCDAVLKVDPTCVKALYRRGRAHARVWNETEARADLGRAAELDSGLRSAVTSELRALEERSRAHAEEQRQVMQGKLFT